MPELWETPVTYGAVGATQAADLLRYPPAGYRPVERRARIGHGDARFDWAWATALSWGIQRGSGFRLSHVESPSGAHSQTYTPVSFDSDGEPVPPSTTQPDATFGPDGTSFVRPGDTAMLRIPVLGRLWEVNSPVRVVYLIDEPKRKGFAYGTLPGHPEHGEEAFIVSQSGDGSVWLTVRAFSRPANRFWWAVYPALRIAQSYYTRRYLRALAVPLE
ncbi:MAG: DUF1990 domain-containing protein [Rhodoglobus sp.]